MKKNFICTQCGLCCRLIKEYKKHKEIYPYWMQELIDEFPYEYDLRTGKCEMLGDDNLCKVYNDRPDLCNIEKIYHRYHWEFPSRRWWFVQNNVACNKMIMLNGIDKKYLINLKDYDKTE